MMPTQYRLVVPLPMGLQLDRFTGVISGTLAVSSPKTLLIVEAELLNGQPVRATIDLEVINFARGGFVVGHLSELSPGTFMLLLYVPDEEEGGEKVYEEKIDSCMPLPTLADANFRESGDMFGGVGGCFPQKGGSPHSENLFEQRATWGALNSNWLHDPLRAEVWQGHSSN